MAGTGKRTVPLFFGSSSILLQGRADHASAGVGTRSIAPARCPMEAKRRVGTGVGCGRGPSAFFEGDTNAVGAPRSQPSPIPAARSRGLPDRTKGGGDVPVRRTHRRSPPAHRRGRFLEKTRGRWRRRQGAARGRRERCLRKIPRYSPLRELATARRQALPRDGPAALPATQSAVNLFFRIPVRVTERGGLLVPGEGKEPGAAAR
jgi:hypothetical protein